MVNFLYFFVPLQCESFLKKYFNYRFSRLFFCGGHWVQYCKILLFGV